MLFTDAHVAHLCQIRRSLSASSPPGGLTLHVLISRQGMENPYTYLQYFWVTSGGFRAH
jgi:hypothetical protein